MAAATGSIAIASAGGSFDSATYPRFVLGDGTNSLTFVIDNDARGLKLATGADADGYSNAGLHLPFEDSQKTRLVVPTFDESDGAKKALLAFWATDEATFDNAWGEIDVVDSSAITAISTRPHFVIRDAAGNEIKIGGGGVVGQSPAPDIATALSNSGYSLLATYSSSGSPRFYLYKKDSAAEYFIRVVSTGSSNFRVHTVFGAALKHAADNSLIDITTRGILANGSLTALANVANNTYTASEIYGLVMEYDTAGFAGNACYMEFKDPNTDFDTDAKRRCMSWGYSEYATTNVYTIGRHAYTGATDNQFWGENLNSKIWFRQGTIAGSGSDASLSTANIAEAIKEMINASILGITATRSDSTVSLTNDTDGDSGNVTITTTNAGALFTVAGMDNTESGGGGGGGGGGGNDVARRSTVSADQLELKSSGGLSASTDNKAGLRLSVDQLAATASIMGSSFIPMEESGGTVSKKISVDNLLGSLVAGSDTQIQFNQHGTTFAASSGLTFDGTGSLTAGTAMNTVAFSGSGDSTIHKVTMNQLVAATADINGGTVDGAVINDTTIGATTQASGKFTTISGSSTLDIAGQSRFGTENQTTISSVGLLSSSATATLANATLDQVTVGSADINGGAIDGATIGASSQSSVKATTLSGSSTLSVEGASTFGPGGLVSISAAGVISGSATSTLHQLTADRVTVNTLDVNTINSNTVTQNTLEVSDFRIVAGVSGSSSDLSGGGFQIGGGDGGDGFAAVRWNDSEAGLRINSGSTTVLKVNSSGLQIASGVLSGSGVSTLHRLTLDRAVVGDADINGGAIDGTTIGASSQAAGSFTTVSGSGDSTIHKVTMNQLVAATADINGGTVDGAAINNTTIGATTPAAAEFTTISGSSTLDIAGQSRFGTENQTTISAVGLLSSSATATLANATLDQVTVGSADINGGAIDGATIGASSQSSVKATTLSGSSTLNVAGVSSFGAGGQATISAAGLISSSAENTAFKFTLDRLTAGDVDINGGAVDGVTIGANSAGAGTFTTLDCTDGAFAVDNLDIDGATDIGAALVAADLIMVDDGANGTNRKCTIERIGDFVGDGNGLQVTSGKLSITSVEDHFVSSSANEGLKFLMSQTASSDAAISVYINGIFQAQSGSSSVHGSGNGDYSISGSTLNGQFVVLVDANELDAEDEVVVKYIKA